MIYRPPQDADYPGMQALDLEQNLQDDTGFMQMPERERAGRLRTSLASLRFYSRSEHSFVSSDTLSDFGDGLGIQMGGRKHLTPEQELATAKEQAESNFKHWQRTAADFQTRPKGDGAKVALAARLRAETTMTAGWIAERLHMGTRGYLNHLLYRQRKPRRE